MTATVRASSAPMPNVGRLLAAQVGYQARLLASGRAVTIGVGFPTAVPLWAIFLGLVLAGAVGIFFGVYPASKAAKLDPVVALRAEM